MTNAQFSKIVKQYQRLVYSVCFQLVRDPHISEDLAQETFLAAFTRIDTCPEEFLQPWLARIAANKAKDYLKSAWVRRVTAPGEEEMPEQPGGPPGPEDLAVSADEAGAIRQMILQLKEPYLQVATLYFLQHRTVQEIAQLLDRPPKTVHTQLYRARQLLKERIRERREAQ